MIHLLLYAIAPLFFFTLHMLIVLTTDNLINKCLFGFMAFTCMLVFTHLSMKTSTNHSEEYKALQDKLSHLEKEFFKSREHYKNLQVHINDLMTRMGLDHFTKY